MTQTTVSILAISLLITMVTLHHQREGQLMTQTQEEMLLIGGFALFWIAILVGWRALRQSGESGAVQGLSAGGRRNSRPYGLCSDDDVYCVVEEYFF
ncbi:hypothetical protein BDQ17DRAFT_97577 [Cyathus striatus]|nr:hypothetical protein BDQ17DRAFT_97577 [Cyathus striatus]